MEAILLMFLSILWLTSIIHNSSIDIASCPMDPLTWFNVSWNASYIINIHEFSQIHYPPARSRSARDPILSQQEFDSFSSVYIFFHTKKEQLHTLQNETGRPLHILWIHEW